MHDARSYSGVDGFAKNVLLANMFVKSGAEFEHFVARVFEENGHHAEVTQASGDYGVDLVLNGEIAVQVKFYGSVVGPTAVQEVAAGKAVYECSEAWVVTNSTYTPAAVTLAEANGVRLIGGEELQWLAENPDNSADHRAQFEAAKLEELLERIHRINEARAAEEARSEALRLEQVADWKAKREAEIAAGARTDAEEQARLADAARILDEAGYIVPQSTNSMSSAQTFRHLIEREQVRNEAAHSQQFNTGTGDETNSVASNPPAGWFPDPTGASRLRWWDGQQWTSAVH